MKNKLKNLLYPPEFDHNTWTELHIAILETSFLSIFMNILIATVMLFSFAGTIPDSILYGWYGLIALISLARISMLPYYKRQIGRNHERIHHWVFINRIGLFITGVLWGSSIFWHEYGIDAYQEILLGFVIMGLAGGSAVTNAPSIVNLIFYIVPLISPMVFWYGTQNNITLNSIAVLMLFYLLYLLLISHRAQKVSLLNTALRIKNEALAQKFKLINANLNREISSRIQAQQDMEAAKEDAENANRAKSEFLSSMSHELRTPLNAIIGFSEIILEDANHEDKEHFVNNIHTAGKHLHSLIDEILDLARIEAGHIEIQVDKYDLNLLIEECVILISQQALSRGISIEYSGSPLSISNDRKRCKQIILNLLSNAIKYNKDNGSVRIMLIEEGDYIELYVIDSGVGISSEQLDLLFQPFNRLEHRYSDIEGSGLGLAITKNLLELMDGTITVESKPDIGTTFIIRMPR